MLTSRDLFLLGLGALAVWWYTSRRKQEYVAPDRPEARHSGYEAEPWTKGFLDKGVQELPRELQEDTRPIVPLVDRSMWN